MISFATLSLIREVGRWSIELALVACWVGFKGLAWTCRQGTVSRLSMWPKRSFLFVQSASGSSKTTACDETPQNWLVQMFYVIWIDAPCEDPTNHEQLRYLDVSKKNARQWLEMKLLQMKLTAQVIIMYSRTWASMKSGSALLRTTIRWDIGSIYTYIYIFFSSNPRVELQNSVRLLSCRSQQLLCQQYQRLRGSVWYKLPGIVIWIWDRSFWIMLLGYCFFTVERKRVEVTCRAIDTCWPPRFCLILAQWPRRECGKPACSKRGSSLQRRPKSGPSSLRRSLKCLKSF